MPDPLPYRVTLAAPTGSLTLDLLATNKTNAILSARELSGLGRRVTVARCCRLGDW
jgi:hypothetical protein